MTPSNSDENSVSPTPSSIKEELEPPPVVPGASKPLFLLSLMLPYSPSTHTYFAAAEEYPCFSLFTAAAEQPPQIKRVLSHALPDGPRASHTFAGLSDCPRVFVSVKAELIDMSYYNERENVRARVSGASRDKPSLWSECRFNSVVDRGSTCGEEGYVMCGEDAAALVGPSGDLTVEVLGSKHVTQPCDDGVALSALVTVECGGSSAVICPISGTLGSTESRHCRDESSFLPPPPSPSPPPPPSPPQQPMSPEGAND